MTDAPLDPALILERVELALPELFPGFRTEERRVSFDGVPVADFLGRAEGRTLMVSLVDGDEAAVALKALDGLAFARGQRELLADYLPGETFTGRGPEVVLVAQSFSAGLRARLSPLMGEGDLVLVTRHELSTARGSLTRLRLLADAVPGATSAPGPQLPSWAMQEPLLEFLGRLAPDRLALGLQLLERIQRIDPGIAWGSAEDGSLRCLSADQLLCTLAWVDGHLELSLGEGTVPHAIRDEDAIDFVLDWVLSCFIELVEEARLRHQEPSRSEEPQHEPAEPAASSQPAPTGASSAPQEPSSAPSGAPEAAADELEELEEFELRPAPPPPLLSREELEAFLD
jgi:hypothetical protein